MPQHSQQHQQQHQHSQQHSQPAEPPGLRDLLIVNLKVVGVLLLVLPAAWLVWLGLAALFPKTHWLQFPN